MDSGLDIVPDPVDLFQDLLQPLQWDFVPCSAVSLKPLVDGPIYDNDDRRVVVGASQFRVGRNDVSTVDGRAKSIQDSACRCLGVPIERSAGFVATTLGRDRYLPGLHVLASRRLEEALAEIFVGKSKDLGVKTTSPGHGRPIAGTAPGSLGREGATKTPNRSGEVNAPVGPIFQLPLKTARSLSAEVLRRRIPKSRIRRPAPQQGPLRNRGDCTTWKGRNPR